MIVGSGGLYSTADDILRWIGWHLDRFATRDAETRLLDHALMFIATGSIRCSASTSPATWTRWGSAGSS